MKIIAALISLLALQDRVSPDLLDYQPVGRLEGTLKLGPPGAFEKLLVRWAERMKEHYPDLRGGQPEGNLPATPSALASGVCQVGILSRPWTRAEVGHFRFFWGYSPTEVVVGMDAITLVVHPDNPIRDLLLDDLDSIFSATRRRGGKPIRTWGELGLEGEWKRMPIHLYGLTKDSSTRAAFQDKALCGGIFQKDLREASGVDSLLTAVAEDPLALAFVSEGVRSGRCRAVPLRATDEGPAVDPTPDSILSLSYPLSWRVFLAVRKVPRESLEPVVAEFLKMVLSRDGQEILAGEGYLPITGQMAHKELKRLKLE